jgi:NitT/TauT family transport system permease protein
MSDPAGGVESTIVSIPPRRNARSLFRIGAGVPRGLSLALSVGAFGLVLVMWVIATERHWTSPFALPRPVDVWERFADAVSRGELWDDARVSIYRIFIGFLIAAAVAIPVGVLTGAFRMWHAVLTPLVEFFRYPPVVAFIPLSIFWVGIDDSQKFLIVFLGTVFQLALLVADDIRRVPMDHVEVGRTLGMRESAILGRIVVPSAMPAIWDSLRITLGWAWTWVTLAEIVNVTSGFGYRINRAQVAIDNRLVFAYIVVLGILGLATDQGMRLAGRVLFRWSQAER